MKKNGEKKNEVNKRDVKMKELKEKVVENLGWLKEIVDHIVEERGLERDQVMVRVGLDGGQGSFKVVVSIFETGLTLKSAFQNQRGQVVD